MSPAELTDERGGGGGRGAKSYAREKAWSSVNYSILAAVINTTDKKAPLKDRSQIARSTFDWQQLQRQELNTQELVKGIVSRDEYVFEGPKNQSSIFSRSIDVSCQFLAVLL